MSRPPLSIIIPCLNAMPRLADCLAALVAGLGDGLVRQAIVVDGSSSDASAHLAMDMGCKVVVVPTQERGRAKQMRAGNSVATGEWLLFLHADTVLQEGWVAAVWAHIASGGNKAGYFCLAFDQSGAGPKRVAAMANWRARRLGLPYGDQGLLISRALYDQIGGFGDMALMEDVDIVRRLTRARLVELNGVAITSGAKYARGGWWGVPARNLFLMVAYLCGVKPDVLARWYR
jgi:rSAM/selenodomain-associated transferase 2